MARINMILNPEVHQPQDNININNEITIDDQILIRTSRYPSQGSHVSPTPEGRHQDNTEISSVTMIGRYNVTGGGRPGSGTSLPPLVTMMRRSSGEVRWMTSSSWTTP